MKICTWCKKRIMKEEKHNKLMGLYSHDKCDKQQGARINPKYGKGIEEG